MASGTLSLQTPEEVRQSLAKRFKALRLRKGWKQETLATRSGVSLGSLKRFESLGEVSLSRLLRLAHALGCLDAFNQLAETPTVSSMAELEREATESPPKRGRK